MAKQKDKEAPVEFECYYELKEAFETDKPARAIEFTEEEMKLLKDFILLTIKPVLYVANVSEDDSCRSI